MEQLIIPRHLKKESLTEYLTFKLEELADEICQDASELEAFCNRWTGGFRNYSFKNTLLIYAQRPDATLVAGYRAWQERGRQVMRGEFGIRIFAPSTRKIHKSKENEEEEEEEVIITGFRPISVFAVQQTAIHRSFVAKGQYFHDILDPDPVWYPEFGCSDLVQGEVDLKKAIEAIPVPIILQDCGCSNGKTDGKTIYITPKNNKASMVNTLFHEYAHILLDFNDSRVLYDLESRSAAEIVAESVAFIVSSYFSIKNEKARLYISNWGADSEKLRGSGKKIISTAEYIIRLITS